jgi:hypothetical protein
VEPCPNCGQPVRATARFCTSCGYRIPERAQGSTSSATSGFASSWIEESTGTAAAAEPVAAESTWPAAPAAEVVEETVDVVETAETVPAVVYAPPVVAVDPIDEIVAATAGYNDDQDSIVDMSQNKVNIALYHIETLRQLIPELSAWSIERAQSVNEAIAAMETAIKGREADDDTYYGLRQTVASARKDPRDIDVMIALSDRALDIEDLLKAHDAYSIGIRKALIDLKPLAVEYVRVPKRRAAPARKSSTTRSRSTASKSTTAAKTTATPKTAAGAKTAKPTSTTSTRKTTTRTATTKS